MDKDGLPGLEEALGYRFRDSDLLLRALTHSSHSGESGSERLPQSDNEQLEFLGDAVLGAVVSEHLFRTCPEFDEGRLSNVKAALVNRAHLADVARELDLGKHLLLGRGEESTGGRAKSSLLANALEAVLASVYLDGGWEALRPLVLRRIVANADVRALAVSAVNNTKTSLEMAARARGLPRPEYSVRAESFGYPQIFIAEVRVGSEWHQSGRGTSKKAAQMEAASALLAQLEAQSAVG